MFREGVLKLAVESWASEAGGTATVTPSAATTASRFRMRRN
jgi:hypothetical protein